jgi:uncharacterized LabA/DUF88 family protein
MKKCVILVDNSNLFIEGQKFSARKRGLARSDRLGRQVADHLWRVDFGKLIASLANGRLVHSALLVGSRPPKSDSVWRAAESHGFQVIVHDRNMAGKEKAVDTELAVRGTKIILRADEPMALIIVSGDTDFVPLAQTAREEKWRVEMAAFTNAYNPKKGLAMQCDHIYRLDDLFDSISAITSDHDQESESA